MPDEPTPEEWAEIEAADAYLDALGNKRDFQGDQLGGTQWRQNVDREPFDDGRLSTTISNPGGTPMSDSIYDRAAQLYQLASNGPTAEIHAAMQAIQAWGDRVRGVLGQTTGGVMLQGLVERALQTCQELMEGIENAKNTAEDEARKHLG